MYCKNCGNEIKENYKFCSTCGTTIIEDAVSKNRPIKNRKVPAIAVLIGLAIVIFSGLVYFIVTHKETDTYAKSKLNNWADFLTYKTENNGTEIYISKCDKSINGKLEIPGLIEGLPVTTIEKGAFNECADLTSLSIPYSISNIEAVFSYCFELTDINVEMGNAVYYSEDGVLFKRMENSLQLLCCPIGKTGTCTIPDGVTEINGRAFVGCKLLTGITIPESIESIYASMFFCCDLLKTIVINPDNPYICIIDQVVFSKDMSKIYFGLRTLSGTYFIPDSVNDIAYRAFDSCKELTAFKISEDNSYFKCVDGVLLSGSAEAIYYFPPGKRGDYFIPDTVTYLSEGTFSGCNYITSLTIPYSVTSIDDWAFYGCKSLISINVNTDNEDYCSVDGVLFENEHYKKILMCYPQGKIGEYSVPVDVVDITECAFTGCSNLTSLSIPSGVSHIDEPYSAFLGCSSLTDIYVSRGNTDYYSEGGVLFEKTESIGSALLCCPNGKKGMYTVPNNVTEISSNAFFGCTSIIRVTVPSSVNYIADYSLGYGQHPYYNNEGVKKKIDKFIIYCYPNSSAQEYAIDNNLDYEFVSS